MFALLLGTVCAANAQEVKNDENGNSVSQVTQEVTATSEETTDGLALQKDVYPQQGEDGDLYHGLTRKLMFDRMIPPHGLEVTYDKTVHILFPAPVRYVDLGSPNLIAGKADGAENVIRVKATVKNFHNETNMSVITEDGSFYTFNVKYADEPLLLNVEMADFLHDGSAVNRPNNAQEIYLKELGSESPMLVRLIMKSIHKENKRTVKHIGSKSFGIQYILKGVYVHNDLLYLHTDSGTRPTCLSMWTISVSRSWTRRWRNAPPFRNRYCSLSEPSIMPCVWLESRRNAPCSVFRNSPSPMTSSLWSRCARRTEAATSPLSWRTGIWSWRKSLTN